MGPRFTLVATTIASGTSTRFATIRKSAIYATRLEPIARGRNRLKGWARTLARSVVLIKIRSVTPDCQDSPAIGLRDRQSRHRGVLFLPFAVLELILDRRDFGSDIFRFEVLGRIRAGARPGITLGPQLIH